LFPLTGCPSATESAAEPKRQPGGIPATTGTKRIIFVTNGDDPFWDACLSGLKEGEKQHELAKAGLKVERDVNNGTAEGQIEKLRQYATQDDIAGVAISVIQADNLAIVEEMKNLQKKGVKIITVDGDESRTHRDARTYYIGTDNIVGGRTLGTTAKAILESRGKTSGGYVQFAGFVDNDNARSRMNGFQEAIGESYQELARMPDGMDKSKARDKVGYCVFGKVVKGMDVVDKIKDVKTKDMVENGRVTHEAVPTEDVVIKSITRKKK
jgi:ribose transport system substrate-binding protein